ncbi:VOC family protein [Burkholderia stagnalis]|uniref:VOC family protein n=1 Tax=Burkholderia stagnalis TaxID=1503054 RepID=UPI002AB567AE|nr:VOC family protein [Burkholderia stagnalis]MDY7803522.1 VOC family protein [Burkholderia stagnalis]
MSVPTIGVDDLETAMRFYRDGLGLETEGIVGTEFEHGAVSFFDLQSSLKLRCFASPTLRTTPECPSPDAARPSSRSVTTWTARRSADEMMQQAVAAGARLVKPAGTTFRGGYSGYFQDPDGHLREVVFNSAFAPGD